MTLGLGYQATKLRLNSSFEETIPTHHPYIATYLKHKADLGALGNAVRITVESNQGTIYYAAYLATLQQLSEEVFLIPGVNRPFMKSLWTPNMQWFGVTEQGFDSGPVIPEVYTGRPRTWTRCGSTWSGPGNSANWWPGTAPPASFMSHC